MGSLEPKCEVRAKEYVQGSREHMHAKGLEIYHSQHLLPLLVYSYCWHIF